MTRRSFFQTLLAVPLARLVPKRKPSGPMVTPAMQKAVIEGIRGYTFNLPTPYWLRTYPLEGPAKIGDTVVVKYPTCCGNADFHARYPGIQH